MCKLVQALTLMMRAAPSSRVVAPLPMTLSTAFLLFCFARLAQRPGHCSKLLCAAEPSCQLSLALSCGTSSVAQLCPAPLQDCIAKGRWHVEARGAPAA